jgi:hypothetical protein
MGSRKTTFESIVQHFCARRGLYFLGAGASAGLAPLGNGLYRIVALDWWRNGGGFRPDIPFHSPLVEKIIASQRDCSQEEIWGVSLRPGTVPFPAVPMLERLPNSGTRLRVMHELVRARHEDRGTDSYRVFRSFHPSTIMNYNHDGLASAQCGEHHVVIDVHAAIHPGYGSPDFERLIPIVRDYDLSLPPDDLIMCERERPDDATLLRRLALAEATAPDFIAVIGYSFAKIGDGLFDDCVSLDWFRRQFHGFPGSVYVIGPDPDELEYLIADSIKSNRVIGVRACWNILAHAFMLWMQYHGRAGSIYADHERLLAQWGPYAVFPRRSD